MPSRCPSRVLTAEDTSPWGLGAASLNCGKRPTRFHKQVPTKDHDPEQSVAGTQTSVLDSPEPGGRWGVLPPPRFLRKSKAALAFPAEILVRTTPVPAFPPPIP